MEWTDESLLSSKRRRTSRVGKSEDDGRNPFENDYSRIILSSSLRRLQDKAQVFPLDDSDFIRTRLTHSIEVSAIASSIGASIEQYLVDEEFMDSSKYKGHIKSILSSVGLLHDIGNTPFGHFGEYAVQEFFKKFFSKSENKEIIDELTEEQKMDFLYFDGNAHVLRLVTKLQYVKDIYGLNLTYATLASLIKYPRSSKEGNKKGIGASYNKYGYFQSEQETFTDIVKKTNIISTDGRLCRHPLVFLMEAADDIAYSVADIEDGIKKKVLTIDEINRIIKEYLNYNDDGSKRNLHKEEKEILDILITPIDDNYPNSDERIIQLLRATIQSFMIKSVINQFKLEYVNIMEGRFDEELLEKSKAWRLRQAFKKISSIIFENKEIMKNELAGEKIINNLLELFVGAVTNKDNKGNLLYQKNSTKESKLFDLISDNYRYIYQYHSSKSVYDRLLLVTDYICGMTDCFALELYKKINGIII